MLPSIEEAWSLPIPAELTSRQGALSTAQAQQVSIQFMQETTACQKLLEGKYSGGLFKAEASLSCCQTVSI